MKTTIPLLLIAFALSVSAGQKSKPKPPPTPTSFLDASNWTFFFGWPIQFYNGHPSTHPGGGFQFDFPMLLGDVSQCWPSDFACPQVDYILAPWTQPITGKSYLQITVDVQTLSGSPIWNYQMEQGNTCDFPAHVRAIIWSCKESCAKPLMGLDPYGRWWSNPAAILLDSSTGNVTIQIPIDPSQWTSVYGERGTDNASALAGWLATFGAPGKVGFTFGGGCFFGHGVNVSNGSARFIVTDYSFH